MQLEKEQQDLLVKQEALKGQVCRLTRDLEASEKRTQEIKNSLTQQASAQEAEFQQVVTNLKKQNEETVRKLTEERVSGSPCLSVPK
jgi:rootletin